MNELLGTLTAKLSTPQGLIIAALGAFILVTLLVSFAVFRMIFRKKSDARDVPRIPVDPLTDEEEDEGETGGPWKKAPIALARLRFGMAPFELPQEPQLKPPHAAPVQEPQPVQAHQVQQAPYAEPLRPAQPVQAVQHPQPAPQPLPRLLYTLPFQSRRSLRPAHADICGMGIEAVFFPPEEAAADTDPARRLVPFLPAGVGRVLTTEGDGVRFRMGELVAEPDAVIELPAGLIILEVKPKGGRPDDPLNWAQTIREKDLLQTLAAAIAAAHQTGRPAAAVLRTTNAVYFLRPGPAAVKFLADAIEPAHELWRATSGDDRPGIAALDFAAIVAAPFARRWPKPEHEGHRDGRERHKAMLQT